MRVTKDTAAATMTDVKNKIGDVFSLVDDFGEVTITSYNKPAYKIIKITAEEKKEIKKQQKQASAEAREQKKIEKEARQKELDELAAQEAARAAALEAEKQALTEQLAEQQKELEQTQSQLEVEQQPEPIVEVTKTIEVEAPVAEVPVVPIVVNEVAPEPAIGTDSRNSIVDFIAKRESAPEIVDSGFVIWDRTNKAEKTWVQKVRNLL